MKGQEELVVGGRTGEDPHVNGGGGMLPDFPVCYWGFTHLIPPRQNHVKTSGLGRNDNSPVFPVFSTSL